MAPNNRARLGRADFDAMVADIAGQQNDRLGLGWIKDAEPRQDDWVPEIQGGPRLVYNGGEAVFSTTQDLVRWPLIIWDTNGYYNRLSVHPRATREEIRKAYARVVGSRQDTATAAWFTYVMGVLLDPVRREKYDATPLGSLFNDLFLQEAAMIADKAEASKKLASGEVTFEELIDMQQAAEGLDDDGIEVDDDALARSREKARTSRHEIVEGGRTFRWSYFVCDSEANDLSRLARWQQLLVRYISRRKEGIRIAIGFIGETDLPYEVRAVGYRTVVFLNDSKQPTRRLAKQATSAVVKHIRANRPAGS